MYYLIYWSKKLNKIIIAGAILAAGAGAFIISQKNAAPTYNVLEYIPADTPILAAQLQPFPLRDYLASSPKMPDTTLGQNSDPISDTTQPAKKFLSSLFTTYEASLKDSNLFMKTYGLPDEIRSYFYTLGLLPVFKIEIANEQAIWDLLDKAELDSGFIHKSGKLENISYRAYTITDETDPVYAEVIVAIDKGFLTITLNSSYNEESLLASALGLTKAQHSIAASGMVEQIIKQHNFMSASIGFINHVEIVKGLTTTDGNQLAKQISAIQKKQGGEDPFAQIRSEQCAQEFATIAANWPRTVGGYTQLDVTKKQSTFALSTVVESKNPVILNALSTLRGFIPKYTNDIDNNVLTMALGLDVNQLGTSINTIWGDLQTPTYQCQPLAEMQAKIAQSGNSIGMLSMGANMLTGVQGVSIGILDYALSNIDTNPQLDSLDALFAISAENPEQLFNSGKMFIPELQQIQLTNGGEPIALSTMLPIPSKLNLDPQLAIKGKHLLIYNGEKGKQAATALSSEALTKNGFFNLGLDTKKLITPMITAAELSGEEIPEQMMFLKEYDIRMQMGIDTNNQGVMFNSKTNSKAPK